MSIIKSIKQVLGLGPAAETSVWDGTPSAPNVPKLTLKQGNIPNNIIEVLNGVLSFPNQGQSLASDGYVKLPGGLIIQWGAADAITTDTGTTTFPIPFPTSCALVMVSPVGTSATTPKVAVSTNPTTTSFSWIRDISTFVGYIAIGY